MSILDSVGLKNVQPAPYLNTGTLLDIALGVFEKGVKNHWILNGGLAPITGMSGRAGTYKSTVVDSIITQILLRYPSIEVWKHDTEQNVFTLTRFDKMAKTKKISSSIRLTNSAEMPLPDFMESLQEICKHKEKNKHDYLVESPFFDDNGVQRMMWIPTLIDIDSFSCLRPLVEEVQMGKVSVEDGSHNMADMTDGKIKRKLMFEFSRLASRYGIYFILTAHIDDAHVLDPRNPPQKQLQFLKMGDRIKGVGSQFEFLTNVLLQGTSPAPIIDSNKGPEYPDGNTMNVDINELYLKILRCKTNATGTIVPLVMSQNLGILAELTNYHFLKNSNDFGFIKKGHNRYCLLDSETLLHRNSIIEVLSHKYETARALEILAQLKWIASYWNIKSQPVNIPETAERFVELIAKSDTIAISDILNSRGYWTFGDETDTRPYMSIFDILDIIDPKNM